MAKIYICPNCNELRLLDLCLNCNCKIKTKKNIYFFLKKVNTFFNSSSNYYEQENKEIFLVISEVIEAIMPQGRILDLGCGDGRLITPLIKDNYDVIGMDFSFKVLKSFQSKLKFHSRDNYKLILADAHKIPLKENSVDLVIANNLFHLLESPDDVIAEIKRVLNEDGYLLQISNNITNEYFCQDNNFNLYFKIINSYNNFYLESLKKYNLKLKEHSNFNIYKSLQKNFKLNKTVQTKTIIVEHHKNIKDFFARELKQLDYLKQDIPKNINQAIIKNFLKYLKENKLLNLETRFKESLSFIIDSYSNINN